ncbi:hypothetical protein BD289DRAFT_409610 [Coniella lustricola]|uniref:UAS domain-containing protein n=1 Tax=Coniella lustricola TaxID=2025994 RepID=A0A2T3A7X0_9PEZI|nr:hypothetical protein BD289DRAFT_409610 [Coniella lustricola]
MASEGDFDLAQLSPSQQEALQQYIQFTNQDPKDAVPLLERSQWNVQIAITKFFDGDAPDPVAEAQAQIDAAPPRPAGRHENLQESFHAPSARLPRAHRTDPAPRVVLRPASAWRPPWLVGLFLMPFQLGWKLFTTIFRPITYILSFLPRSLRPRALSSTITRGLRNTNGRKMLLPRDSAARFKREFEEEYGANTLPWYEGGFAQAQDLAKKELKYLLVVLMSPEHDDTAAFAHDVLLSPEVADYISDPANNIVLWGGNVLDSEAYIVSNEYNCTKFPFSVLISLTPKEGTTRMGIIKRLVGHMPASAYLAGIRAAISKYAPDLEGLRAERVVQQTARNLRSEQDSAYERSLAKDRERARQKREAEQAAADAEKRAQEEVERAAERERQRQLWKRWRVTTIVPEPAASEPDVVRLALKMPEETGAGRVIRRFAGTTTVEELYAFVECYDLLQKPADESDLDEKFTEGGPEGYEHVYKFRLASLLPREVFEPTKDKTLRETIGKSGNLIVEDVVEDEEEEANE